MQYNLVPQIVTALATSVLVVNIITIFLLAILIFQKVLKNPPLSKIYKYISNNSVELSLIISTGAVMGSLFLSEVAKFPPCKLCWEQRIFLFPQPIILLIGLLTNDTKVKKYILALSLIGLAIAIYHILLQSFPQAFECSDEIVSCTQKYTAHFGYITIPVMSASTFAIIILLNLFKKSSK